jgi:hypothetical protein
VVDHRATIAHPYDNALALPRAKDEQWEETPPFEPARRDGYLYGRGTSDAKGQVLAHVWAVGRASGQFTSLFTSFDPRRL